MVLRLVDQRGCEVFAAALEEAAFRRMAPPEDALTHLEGCSRCKARFEAGTRFWGLLRLREQDPPSDLAERVLTAVRDAKAGHASAPLPDEPRPELRSRVMTAVRLARRGVSPERGAPAQPVPAHLRRSVLDAVRRARSGALAPVPREPAPPADLRARVLARVRAHRDAARSSPSARARMFAAAMIVGVGLGGGTSALLGQGGEGMIPSVFPGLGSSGPFGVAVERFVHLARDCRTPGCKSPMTGQGGSSVPGKHAVGTWTPAGSGLLGILGSSPGWGALDGGVWLGIGTPGYSREDAPSIDIGALLGTAREQQRWGTAMGIGSITFGDDDTREESRSAGREGVDGGHPP